MKKCVVAVDCGTTSIKAAVLDEAGNLLGSGSRRCPLRCRADGRVEVSASSLVRQVFECIRESIEASGNSPGIVAALSITNQRATVVCVGKDGRPVGPAVSWMDMRDGGAVAAVRKRIGDAAFTRITGLPLNPVFSFAKVMRLAKEESARFRRVDRFVLVHDFILHALGCERFVCDVSNASLTGWLDLKSQRWSDRILDAVGIESARLPELVPCGVQVGEVSREAGAATGLRPGTPLVSGGGDQQCCALGAGAVASGTMALALGTAAVPLCTATNPKPDAKQRVMCCVHAVPGRWSVEGLQNAAGASLNWLAGIMSNRRRVAPTVLEGAMEVPPGANGILFFPYLAGAAAPHWMADARGAFIGLALGHGRCDMVRAVMEGVSLETREILDACRSLGLPVKAVRTSGGFSQVEGWNQILADVMNCPVEALENPEAGLTGAAILAYVGTGRYRDVEEAVSAMVKVGKRYAPCEEGVAAYVRIRRRYGHVGRELRERHLLEIPTERP